MRRWVGIGALALLLAGCAPLPVPQHMQRQYFPLLERPVNKLGVAGCPASCGAMGCSWCYSWVPQPGCVDGVDRVPMIWNETQVYAEMNDCSGWLMGFNEPDRSDQADLSPQAAVKPWRQIEARWPNRKLVAPAPSHTGSWWLPAFREAYKTEVGCYPRFDALAAHCYYGNADACITHVKQYLTWAQQWGVREVWVTEFFFSQEAEARKFIAFLESEPLITRWSPYVSFKSCVGYDPNWDCAKGGNPSLFTADGALTVMGGWYARPVVMP